MDNIKLLGDDLELEGCKHLCCNSESFQFGLFDGSKCFGIQCFGNNDSRCVLKEDGNAVFTIFSLKRAVPTSESKGKLASDMSLATGTMGRGSTFG